MIRMAIAPPPSSSGAGTLVEPSGSGDDLELRRPPPGPARSAHAPVVLQASGLPPGRAGRGGASCGLPGGAAGGGRPSVWRGCIAEPVERDLSRAAGKL